ncbi:MAG: hypothetical protein L0G22_00515 [Propionibacteriaceae bacterium]|nr:hypothetical protein [Propionibacteriaceae bacterium]
MAYPDDPTDAGRVEHRPEFIDENVGDAGFAEPLGDRPYDHGVEVTETVVPVQPVGEKPKSEQARDEARDLADHTKDRAQDVADHAKAEAGAVKDTALAAGSDVVDSAKEQAAHVIDEAKHQSRRLIDEGTAELRTQAGNAQGQIASLVRSLSDELQSMAQGTNESGPMVDLVQRAEQYGHQAAQWLEQQSPDDVLTSVRRYASRNPWTFLAISAGAGLVAARVFRGLQGAKSDEEQRRSLTGTQRTGYYAPAVGGYRETVGLEHEQARAAELNQGFVTDAGVPGDLSEDVVTDARRAAEWGEGR